MDVVGSISIIDNVTPVLKNIRKEQTGFRKEVTDIRKELKRTWDKTYKAKMSTTSAEKKINTLKGKMKKLGKSKISPVVNIRDTASSKIKKINSKLNEMGKKKIAPNVTIKDNLSKKATKIAENLKNIGGKIITPAIQPKPSEPKKGFSLGSKLKGLAKSMVIPVKLAATFTKTALTKAVQSGMELENQKIFLEYSIGAANKDMPEEQIRESAGRYMEALKGNADNSPFQTGEVIQAGTRAVTITGGDTEEAMNLVKLAEDMAAASGGRKTVSDAMEALAAAKQGELEGLKEFNFTVSAEKLASEGFGGVTSDLNEFFGGAAEKLAQSGSGLVSTIAGKLNSSIAGFGLSIVEKLKPALNIVISMIDMVQPYFEKFGGKIAEGIGAGIESVSSVIPVFLSGIESMAPVMTTLLEGFTPLIPQMAAFGSGLAATLHQVMTASLPVIGSIITAVQTMLPAILPLIEAVVSSIGNIIAQGAPVIAGLVEGIGAVVTALAPVFTTIFTDIGDKVGNVLGFVGERMGFIQEVIGTVAPLIGDIISTAWSVISPVMDIVISVFKILFGVVQKIFPGIQKVLETVWGFVKPIVEGIGTVIGEIAGWFGNVADAFTGGGGSSETVGTNAEGDNNWRGGLTWVGEKGAELVNLPRGSRILPHKESIAAAQRLGGSAEGLVRRNNGSLDIPGLGRVGAETKGLIRNITVQIAKLAESIIVKEESDIDELADRIARKVTEVVVNMG